MTKVNVQRSIFISKDVNIKLNLKCPKDNEELPANNEITWRRGN